MCSQSEERKEVDRAERNVSRAEQESNLRNMVRAELKKKSQAGLLGSQREEGQAE